MADKPVRLSALVSFHGEKRTLSEADLRKLATELVRRAVRAAGPHDPLLAEEQEAVAEALTLTLHALGDLDLDDLQAVKLGHESLANKLYTTAGGPDVVRFLGSDAVHAYSNVLKTACLHILDFFTRRSTFVARTLVAQSRELNELVAAVDLLVERVPAQSAEDSEFEERYRAYVCKKHGRLTIYGVDLNESAEWQLDSAYLSLGAVAAEHGHAAARSHVDALRVEAWRPARQAVEHVLADHRSILLRGAAGSGKTTLVQWLAVTTARQADLHGPLSHLLGRIPFVLPLRTLTRDGTRLPAPEHFLGASGCPLAGSAPFGWTHRVLSAGRGLLLVDGIDEIPVQEREQVRLWLRDLYETFPGNRWLVTSRPSAVREHWLADDGFFEYDLAAMTRGEVESFVIRWHAAAGADTALAAPLLHALRTKKDLGRLAVNPLMCGLICALHRERRGFLPLSRKDLYEAALSMLLERRDRERAVHRPGALLLPKEPQVQLLQKLAYWMIRNGRSEMKRADALAVLAEALVAMPYITAPTEEVYQYLLLRSGLLREPAVGAVDFVHRTFQDYLGAKAAVESRDIPLLVAHADQDQWEDVIRLAVAHARVDERAEILDGLLVRGEKESGHRTRMYLLAAACLEHATELDPGKRHEVEAHAQDLVSPQVLNRDSSYALAHAGPVVLELLPGPHQLDDATAARVVTIAARIGTDDAIGVLTLFRHHTDDSVRRVLAGAWPRFDPEEYAAAVIAHLDPAGVTFPVHSDAALEALIALGGRPRVEIHGNLDLSPLSEVPGHVVTELTIRRDTDTDDPVDIDLHGLAHFRRLERLILAPCPGVVDLSALARILTLREIVIREAALVTGARKLPHAEIDSVVPCAD